MEQTNQFPKGAILASWSESDWKNGVQIDQLEELTTLVVRTAYSLYEITVLNGQAGEVLLRGGKYFPERVPARLSGCTFGGSILKRRGIYVGMQMEIVPEPVELVSETRTDPSTGRQELMFGHKVINTSPVRSISVVV